MLAKFTVTHTLLTQEIVNELNSQATEYCFVLTEQMGLVFPPDFCLIVCEFFKSLGYNAAYDLLKAAILSLFSVLPRKTSSKEEKITIFNEGKKFEVTYPFNLSEGQKDKLVDAIAQKILSE